MFDGKLLGAEVADVVKAYVDRQFGAVLDRLDVIERRLDELPEPQPGEDGENGRDGKDVDMEEVSRQLKEHFSGFEKFASDCIDEIIDTKIKAEMSRIEIPVPKNGKDGRDGEKGKDGVGFTNPLINRAGELVLSSTVGDMFNVGRVVGRQGIAGPAGKDADPEDVRKLVRIEIASELVDTKKEFAALRDRFAEDIPAMIGASVKETVAAIAPAKEPGKDADPEIIATMVREQVSSVVAAFEPEKGEPGEPGRDGKDVDMGAVLARVDEQITQKVAAIELPIGPPGDPGEPGLNGKDADMDAAFRRIDEQIAEKVAAIEIPRGEAGPQGDTGPPGLDADMGAAFAHIDAKIEKAVDALPRPADGRTPSAEELWGVIQPAVSKAVSEAMGAIVSVRDVMVNRSGELVATHTDGSMRVVGQVCGRDGTSVSAEEIAEIIRREIEKLPKPRDGIDGVDGKDVDMDRVTEIIERAVSKIPLPKDGKDGLGFDDLDMRFDNERVFTIKFERGERIKEFPFTVPFQIYRGIYKDVESYQKNDIVVFGGSAWIASRDPSGKPGDGQDNGWKLLAKAGRDGKPGEEGKKGDPGRPGRDLTMVGQGGPNDPSR